MLCINFSPQISMLTRFCACSTVHQHSQQGTRSIILPAWHTWPVLNTSTRPVVWDKITNYWQVHESICPSLAGYFWKLRSVFRSWKQPLTLPWKWSLGALKWWHVPTVTNLDNERKRIPLKKEILGKLESFPHKQALLGNGEAQPKNNFFPEAEPVSESVKLDLFLMCGDEAFIDTEKWMG